MQDPSNLFPVEGMETLIVEFQPDSQLSKNGLSRANWRDTFARKKKAREDAHVLGLVEMETGWVPPNQCKVEVKQYWCGKPYDWDGLATLTGPIIDGLVDSGVLPVDDSPKHILEYTMSQERVAHKYLSKVSVTITPVSA